MLEPAFSFCRLPVVAVLMAGCLSGASVTLANLQTIPIPFGRTVTSLAINDRGDIAGTTLSGGFSTSGFFRPASTGVPQQIAQVSAIYTDVNGINNADTLAGYYFVSAGSLQGFTYTGGTYTPVTAGPFTYAFGINNLGDVTGYSSSAGDNATGFLIKNGTLSSFSLPGHPLDTFPQSVNDSDQVVGYTTGGGTAGFLRQSNGSFQLLDFSPRGINDAGLIVGTGNGSNSTAIGILNIAGADYSYAFPGAIDTYLFGINSNNEVLGYYTDATFTGHIFEGQLTPEPGTGTLCAAVLLASLAVVRRRRAT